MASDQAENLHTYAHYQDGSPSLLSTGAGVNLQPSMSQGSVYK